MRHALEFATYKHLGQLYNDQPFIIHPIEVARFLDGLGQRDEVIAAGYLHDVLEDTQTTYEELKKEMGAEVADLVRQVTKSEYNTFPNLATREAVLILFVSRTCNLASMESWSLYDQQKYIEKSRFWKI